MEFKDIIKDHKFRLRRKALLIDTIKDLKEEGVLYKQIAMFMGIEQQRVSKMIHGKLYLSSETVELYLDKLGQGAKK